MEKVCSKCDISKDENSFRWKNKSLNKRHTRCRDCFSIHEKSYWNTSSERRIATRKRAINRREENREFLWNYLLTRSCNICGESDPVVLEFDHRDRDSKEFTISWMITRGFSLDNISNEINKCDILCANCHRRKTSKELGWYKETK